MCDTGITLVCYMKNPIFRSSTNRALDGCDRILCRNESFFRSFRLESIVNAETSATPTNSSNLKTHISFGIAKEIETSTITRGIGTTPNPKVIGFIINAKVNSHLALDRLEGNSVKNNGNESAVLESSGKISSLSLVVNLGAATFVVILSAGNCEKGCRYCEHCKNLFHFCL